MPVMVTDGGYTCDTIEKIGKNKGEIRTFSQDALEIIKKYHEKRVCMDLR